MWFYHAGWKRTGPVWSPDRPPRPLCGAQVLRQPPSGGLLQNARQVAKAKVTWRLQGGTWLEIDEFKRPASWWSIFSMFVYQKYGTLGSFNHWTLDLYGPCGDGHVGRKFKSSKMICKWWCEMRACGVKVGGLSCFLIFCHLLIDAMLITFCYHSSSWWLFQKSYYSRKGVHISKTSLALLADESTFTFPNENLRPSKSNGSAAETVLCFAHLLKGTCLCGSRWPLLKFHDATCVSKTNFTTSNFCLWRVQFSIEYGDFALGNPKDSPRVQSDSRAKDQKEAMCSVKLWDIFLRQNYLELTSSMAWRTQNFKAAEEWYQHMQEAPWNASKLAIRFCQRRLWKCPNIGERIVVPIKQRTFFAWSMIFSIFSFNLTRYVFREVNHLVIGFHDWTKHQTWVCANPLDKNWISSRHIWSLGYVEIHAAMVGHPKVKVIQDFSTSLVVQIDWPYGCEPTSKLLNTEGSSNTRYNQLRCLVARTFWQTCDVYFPNSISVQLSIHESNDGIYYPIHVEWIKSDIVNHV